METSRSHETSTPAGELPLRACACSFCGKHGARTTSDRAGLARIRVHDPAALQRYQFALRTAEMLVCARCGVYVGALMQEGDRAFAVFNVNCFDDQSPFQREVTSVNYEGETPEQRIARRRSAWTPVERCITPHAG